jgi:hypothetical protein
MTAEHPTFWFTSWDIVLTLRKIFPLQLIWWVSQNEGKGTMVYYFIAVIIVKDMRLKP